MEDQAEAAARVRQPPPRVSLSHALLACPSAPHLAPPRADGLDHAPLGASDTGGARQLAAAGLAIALLVLVCAAAYRRFLAAGFVGSDSLSLIETSRFGSWSAALAQFTQPVMAGTSFAAGEVVYRPFVSLTFGLQYALSGLDAAAYHLANLGLHLASTLLVWAVLRSLGLRWWSSLLGGLLFALHPLALASVPVIARRDSLLPVTASLGALLLLLLRRQRSHRQRRGLLLGGALLLMGVALCSKESAFVAVALLPLVLVAAARADGASWSAAVGGGKVLVPMGALAVLVFVLRFAVLGTVGGTVEPPGTHVIIDRYTQVLGAYTRDLIWSFAFLAPSTWEFWPILSGYLLVGFTAGALAQPRRQAAIALAGVAWILAFALFAIALRIQTVAWLAYFALVGLALLWAAGLEGAVVRLREFDRPWRHWPLSVVTPALFVLWLGFLGGSWLATSPLLRDYGQWQAGAAISQRYLDALEACVASDAQASGLRLEGLPSDFDDGQTETSLLDVTLFSDYTIRSALALAFPTRPLALTVASSQTLRAGADALRFQCQPQGATLTFTAST